MSHHYSGPNLGFPRGDARLDFTDLYAFPKPGSPGKSILIMNVHPSASLDPPGSTTAEPLLPEALYELKIDTDGDAVANIAYRCASAPPDAPGRRPRRSAGRGRARPLATGGGRPGHRRPAPVSTGPEAQG